MFGQKSVSFTTEKHIYHGTFPALLVCLLHELFWELRLLSVALIVLQRFKATVVTLLCGRVKIKKKWRSCLQTFSGEELGIFQPKT